MLLTTSMGTSRARIRFRDSIVDFVLSSGGKMVIRTKLGSNGRSSLVSQSVNSEIFKFCIAANARALTGGIFILCALRIDILQYVVFFVFTNLRKMHTAFASHSTTYSFCRRLWQFTSMTFRSAFFSIKQNAKYWHRYNVLGQNGIYSHQPDQPNENLYY